MDAVSQLQVIPKALTAHQHNFYLVILLFCFPSISDLNLYLDHSMSSHKIVYGEGWVELSVIFWSYYCFLLMSFLWFTYSGKWKVLSFFFFQPWKTFLSVVSSDFQLTQVSHCVMWGFASAYFSLFKFKNPVSISYHSALHSVFPAFTGAKQNLKCSAVSVAIAFFSLSE